MIWVTGATGDLGRCLVETLKNLGHPISAASVERVEITHYPSVVEGLKKKLSEGTPSAIFHTAAQVEMFKTEPNPAATCLLNELGTIHLLKALTELDLTPWVCVLGSGHPYAPVVSPDLIHEQATIAPRSAYAMSKYNAEQWANLLASQARIPLFCPRIFSFTAPWQKPSFVVPRLAQLVKKANSAEQVQTGWLGGYRDFLDIRDVCLALVRAMETRLSGIYNVCSGKPTQIRSIAEFFVDQWIKENPDSKPISLKEGSPRPDDVEWLIGDPTKFSSATKFRPEIPWQKTLEEVWSAAKI